MDIDFSGKAYLITGGASGIGAAVATYLARHRGKAVIADINQDAALPLMQAYPDNLLFKQCDVTSFESLQGACTLAEKAFGRLDGAINCAGIMSMGDTVSMAMEEWHRVLNTNLHGVFYACRAALPLLLKNDGGCIINVASISGVRADHGFAAYNTAKAGVINYTRALSLDYAKHNVRALAVCPGYIAAPLKSSRTTLEAVNNEWLQRIPLGRPGSAEEVAQLIVFLLSPAASYLTGTEIVIDGGLGSSNNQPDLPALLDSLQ
jgi:meso-butanediol dehydrogenase/(S,S)-butanediol dehydrogenase/diacetyl reductase